MKKNIVVKKIASVTVTACLLCVVVAGCSVEAEESKNTSNEYLSVLPSEFTDDYIICTDKLNLEIEDDYTMAPSFGFYVLSKEPMSDGDVEVKIDTDVYYSVNYSETEECKGKFSDNICFQYNNIDWSKIKKAEQGSDDKEICTFYDSISGEYDSLTDDQFPQFYMNKYVVLFNTESVDKPEEVTEAEFVIGDFSVKKDIGTISFIEYRSERSNVGDGDLSFDSVGISGANIAGRTDGIINTPPLTAKAKEDIKIKDIYLLNESDSISISETSVDLTSDEININREWKKGEDFEIEKGTELSFDFEIIDSEFAENPNYSENIYILIEYESGGETYVTGTQVLCETRYDGQTMYAMYKDGIDFQSYYEAYPQGYGEV